MPTEFDVVEHILKKLPVRPVVQNETIVLETRGNDSAILRDVGESEALIVQKTLSYQETLDAKFKELTRIRKALAQEEQAIIDLQNKVFWLLKATQDAILHDKKEKDKKISEFAMANQMNIFLDTLLPVNGEGLFEESEIEAIREILTHSHRSGNKWSDRSDLGMSVVYTLCNVLDAVGLCLGWSVDGIADIAIAGAWNIVDSAGTGVHGTTQAMRERRLAGVVALVGVVTMLACTVWAAVEYVVENNVELAAQLCGVSFAVAMITSAAAEWIHQDACLRHKKELIDELEETIGTTEFALEESIKNDLNEDVTPSMHNDSQLTVENLKPQNLGDSASAASDWYSVTIASSVRQSRVNSSSSDDEKIPLNSHSTTKKTMSLKETIDALRKESNSVIIVREGVKILKAIASELNGIGEKLVIAQSDSSGDKNTCVVLEAAYKKCQEKYNKCSALLDSIAIENAQAKNHGRAAASWVFCGVAMSLSAVGTFIAFPPAAAIVSNILNVVSAVFRHAVKHGANDVKNVTQAIQKKNILLADLDRAVNKQWDKEQGLKEGNDNGNGNLSSVIKQLNVSDEGSGSLKEKIPEIASTFRDFYRMPTGKNLVKAAQTSVNEVGKVGYKVVKAVSDTACGVVKVMGKYFPTAEVTVDKRKDNAADRMPLLVSEDKGDENSHVV